MADDEASNPFLPPTDADPARSAPEPMSDPGLNLQGDNYRPMSYDVRRNAPPFDWKTFLKWMAFGVALLWAFVLFVVWVTFQVLDASSGNTPALASAIALSLVAVFLGRIAMRRS